MFPEEMNGYALLAIGALVFCIGLTRFLAMIVGD